MGAKTQENAVLTGFGTPRRFGKGILHMDVSSERTEVALGVGWSLDTL